MWHARLYDKLHLTLPFFDKRLTDLDTKTSSQKLITPFQQKKPLPVWNREGLIVPPRFG
jgi:hypothetical protein